MIIFYFFSCQICITTSTSAGLEQILPWIFYHKVIGVSSFFLFVEGKAASPNVSKVLVTVPVSLDLLFSTFNQSPERIGHEFIVVMEFISLFRA